MHNLANELIIPFIFQEPMEIPFKSIYRNHFSGAKRQKVKSRTFYYIPLYDTLNNLQHIDVQRELRIKHDSQGLIQDFCDGSSFKNNQLFK